MRLLLIIDCDEVVKIAVIMPLQSFEICTIIAINFINIPVEIFQTIYFANLKSFIPSCEISDIPNTIIFTRNMLLVRLIYVLMSLSS